MNKKILLASIPLLVVGFLLLAPHFALAADPIKDGLGTLSATGLPSNGGVSASGTVNSLLVRVINILLFVTAGIAVLFVIVGGFWYITSAGSPEGSKKGKTTVVNAIIGLVIIVLSYVIINVVINTVRSSSSTPGGGGTTTTPPVNPPTSP